MTTEARTPQADRYLEFQAEVPLRPLRSEGDLERAIRMVDSLVDRDDLDRDESDYLVVLSRLIEDYEAEHHPIPAATDAELLRHLIEAKGVTQAEVASGTRMAESTVSEILGGKRSFSIKHVAALARFFHVSPAVFIKV